MLGFNKTCLFINEPTVALVAMTFCAACLPTHAQEPSTELVKKAMVAIERHYAESDLDHIFSGPTAEPQLFALVSAISSELAVALGIPRHGIDPVTGYLPDKNPRQDGFDSVDIKYDLKDLTANFRVTCGVTTDRKLIAATGIPIAARSFEDAEKHLAEKVLKTPEGEPAFAIGAFGGKPLGEAAWHRADPKSRTYELVWLRGLTIVHVQATLKEGREVKDLEAKLDGLAEQLDAWIKKRMFHHYGRKEK